MDIGNLLKDSYTVTMPYPFGTGGVEVTIEFLPLDENRAIRKRHTSVTFVKGKRVDVLDDIKCSVEIARRCVKGWTGFTDGGRDVSCTPENVETLARKDYNFAGFVLASCTSVELMKAVQKEREEREKNSESTSAKAGTSPASPARRARTSKKRTG